MRLSIVVATRGERQEDLKKLTDSIEKHTTDYEVIIANYGGGFNEDLNKGTALAFGDYVTWLHDDNEVTAGWADKLPEAVGAWKVGEMKDTMDIWGGFYTPTERYATDPNESPQYSAFLVAKRGILHKIGPFDENYKRPGYQDVDFGLQIAGAGYEIEPLPGKIIHWVSPHARVMTDPNRVYLEQKWGLNAD